LALAYGACTLQTQIRLAKQRYKDVDKDEIDYRLVNMQTHLAAQRILVHPLEVPGIRLAETTNDVDALLLLRSLFVSSDVDGYIAPNLHSPYHTEKTGHMHPAEVVLFDPATSGLRLLKNRETGRKYNAVALDSLLLTEGLAVCQSIFWEQHKVLVPAVVKHSGGGRTLKPGSFDPCAIDRLSEDEYRKREERARIVGPQLLGTRVHLSATDYVGKRCDGCVTMQASAWSA
jgi:hypothetical protein